MTRDAAPPTALTIAGSDSGGGAGIQADLKTFHRFGVYGTSALTLITAQNTLGVREVHLLPPELVAKQIAAVAEDLDVRAAKTGALGSEELIGAVAAAVEKHAIPHLVVDPVMISKHGDLLLPEGAVETLKRRLFPSAALVTPNLHEAAALLGGPVETEERMRDAARAVCELGAAAVKTHARRCWPHPASIPRTHTGRAAPTRPLSRRSLRAGSRWPTPCARRRTSCRAPLPAPPALETAKARSTTGRRERVARP